MDSGYLASGFHNVGKVLSNNILRDDSPHKFISFCYFFGLQILQLNYYYYIKKLGMGNNISILGIKLKATDTVSGFLIEDALASVTLGSFTEINGAPDSVGRCTSIQRGGLGGFV